MEELEKRKQGNLENQNRGNPPNHNRGNLTCNAENADTSCQPTEVDFGAEKDQEKDPHPTSLRERRGTTLRVPRGKPTKPLLGQQRKKRHGSHPQTLG